MKIVISRLTYNEFDAILKTHPRYCDTQYVDGRFPAFTKIKDSDVSTDGSIRLIQSYPNTQYFQFFGSYLDKINYQFQMAKDYDVMIMLSCDEYIEGDWNNFVKNLEWSMRVHPDKRIFNIPFKVISGDDRPIKSKDRIFVDPKNWTVLDRHWRYRYKGKEELHRAWYMDADINGITIVHDDTVRNKKRNKLMTKYQKIPEAVADTLK